MERSKKDIALKLHLMKLHHHILHFNRLDSPRSPLPAPPSTHRTLLLVGPPIRSVYVSSFLTFVEQWQPLAFNRQMSGNYAKTLAINKWKRRRSSCCHLPPKDYRPGSSLDPIPQRYSRTATACLICFIWHIRLICIPALPASGNT